MMKAGRLIHINEVMKITMEMGRRWRCPIDEYASVGGWQSAKRRQIVVASMTGLKVS